MADADAAKLANPGKRCDISGMSICDNNGSDASAAEGAAVAAATTGASTSPSSAASPNTAASSGYTSLNNHPHGEFELYLD